MWPRCHQKCKKYSGTCNHIAAVLFKVDFAWRNGLTNPACTSQECGWASFRTKHKIHPKRICEMTWSQPKFCKIEKTTSGGINPAQRQQFCPQTSSKRRSKPSIEDFSTLKNDFPDACVFTYFPVHEEKYGTTVMAPFDDKNVERTVEVKTSPPTSLVALADLSRTVAEFVSTIPVFSSSTVKYIEKKTRGQSNNCDWFEERKGRITGSIVHSVLTRSRRLEKGAVVDNTALLKRIIYSSQDPNIPALKYGREMESEAREKYISTMKVEGHKLKVEESGLVVCENHVYLAASPDGLISCQCCGEGVLEIKCPLSVSHTTPSPHNLDCVCEMDGKPAVKRSHPYFSQVMLEMALTKTKWCDLFVYSRHGFLRIRTYFDEEYWWEMKRLCSFFFKSFIANELLSKELSKSVISNEV